MIEFEASSYYTSQGTMIPVPSFSIQSHEVTNGEFEEFVKLTDYITTAEKNGVGFVFDKKIRENEGWILLKGADWKHPQGPGSSIENKGNHPVVQVSYEDACAYCEWKGLRLPYESEWEIAYRYDTLPVSYNHWQGVFPYENTRDDGFEKTSPVGKYGKGASGCYDLRGNVWEWCLDHYHEGYEEFIKLVDESERYKGLKAGFDASAPYTSTFIMKGGSFLCADNYCKGYDNTIRMRSDKNSSFEHVGFRCAK